MTTTFEQLNNENRLLQEENNEHNKRLTELEGKRSLNEIQRRVILFLQRKISSNDAMILENKKQITAKENQITAMVTADNQKEVADKQIKLEKEKQITADKMRGETYHFCPHR